MALVKQAEDAASNKKVLDIFFSLGVLLATLGSIQWPKMVKTTICSSFMEFYNKY
jgi:hypothetical protein